MNRAQLLAKLGRVIHSCETLDQLRVADKYARLAFLEMEEGLSDWVYLDPSLYFAIRGKIRAKKKQILSSN